MTKLRKIAKLLFPIILGAVIYPSCNALLFTVKPPKTSLIIVRQPGNTVIEKKGDIEGIKILSDGKELEQLIQYTFTITNNGTKVIPESTFRDKPIRTNFSIPIKGHRLDDTEPPILKEKIKLDRSSSENKDILNINLNDLLNPDSSITVSVFSTEAHGDPFTVENTNLEEIQNIPLLLYNPLEKPIQEKARRTFFNTIILCFGAVVVILALFDIKPNKRKETILENLEKLYNNKGTPLPLGESYSSCSEMKQDINKLCHIPKNVSFAILIIYAICVALVLSFNLVG